MNKYGGTFSVIGGNGSVPTTKGLSLNEAIERINNKKRGKGRLDSAPEREALPKSVAVALPTSQALGGGVASPLTEQTYDGTLFYALTSSDGLFVFEYPAYTDYLDANNNPLRIIHLDPSP